MRNGPESHTRQTHQLCGTDADILGALSRAARTLRDAGRTTEARELQERVLRSGGTEDALLVVAEYMRTEAVEGCGTDATERCGTESIVWRTERRDCA